MHICGAFLLRFRTDRAARVQRVAESHGGHEHFYLYRYSSGRHFRRFNRNQKKLDIFGVICLPILTSLGGGIIRDVLLGHFPPVSFVESSYFLASALAALFTCLFYKQTDKLKTIIMLFDAVGLGVFTAIEPTARLLPGWRSPFYFFTCSR
nr:TRIC cation channel family protein [Paenibacillus larvae]